MRIVSDPNICGGEPRIKDTRIPVYVVLSHLAAGEDYGTILKNCPRLEVDYLVACLEYAAFLATEKWFTHENCDRRECPLWSCGKVATDRT